MGNFVPNPNMRRELEKAIASQMAEINRELQRVLDRLGRAHKGGDEAAARAALGRELRKLGMTMSAAEQAQYAKSLVAGEQIVAKPGRLRMTG